MYIGIYCIVEIDMYGRNGLIRLVRAMISLPLSQCIPFTLPERKETRVGDDRLSYLGVPRNVEEAKG